MNREKVEIYPQLLSRCHSAGLGRHAKVKITAMSLGRRGGLGVLRE
jgi:hypothetical protein